jgi:hypothetical protein
MDIVQEIPGKSNVRLPNLKRRQRRERIPIRFHDEAHLPQLRAALAKLSNAIQVRRELQVNSLHHRC